MWTKDLVTSQRCLVSARYHTYHCSDVDKITAKKRCTSNRLRKNNIGRLCTYHRSTWPRGRHRHTCSSVHLFTEARELLLRFSNYGPAQQVVRPWTKTPDKVEGNNNHIPSFDSLQRCNARDRSVWKTAGTLPVSHRSSALQFEQKRASERRSNDGWKERMNERTQ